VSRGVVVAALALALAVGCATARPAPSGTLKVECNVPEATLRIDDVLLGRVADWTSPRALGAGFHRLEIGEPGHYTFYAEIKLREGEGTVVRALLRPLLE
jgi:hypothetical protein